MKQRTPMSRGAGFKRQAPSRPAIDSTERRASAVRALMNSTVHGLHKGTMESGGGVTVPKEPKPVRDEAYRRLVAQLPCFQCRVEGASQCAHPNTDKAKGRKLSDDLCFPLCHVGAKDCHARYDQYRLIPKADMPAYERKAYVWTVLELIAHGLWPMGRPIPDLRRFN